MKNIHFPFECFMHFQQQNRIIRTIYLISDDCAKKKWAERSSATKNLNDSLPAVFHYDYQDILSTLIKMGDHYEYISQSFDLKEFKEHHEVFSFPLNEDINKQSAQRDDLIKGLKQIKFYTPMYNMNILYEIESSKFKKIVSFLDDLNKNAASVADYIIAFFEEKKD